MKKGFYYHKGDYDERCYYLTGEKKGNKWIHLGTIDGRDFFVIPNPEWWTLNWMCIPTAEELKDFTYSETNPTRITL